LILDNVTPPLKPRTVERELLHPFGTQKLLICGLVSVQLQHLRVPGTTCAGIITGELNQQALTSRLTCLCPVRRANLNSARTPTQCPLLPRARKH